MASWDFVPKAFKYAWAQILLALLIGIVLTYPFGEEKKVKFNPWHDIGIGLIVAAAVTTFWQFREFEEFFHRFAQEVLVDDKYLDKLNDNALNGLRSRAARTILENRVDNPKYDLVSLGEWTDNLLFRSLLPGETTGSGVYREEFDETIALEFPTLKEALNAVGSDCTGISAEQLSSGVLKVTSTTTYRVVAPRLNDKRYDEYPVSYGGNGADLPNFPLEQRIRVRVGHSQETASELKLNVSDEGPGGISYEAEPKSLQFDKNGFCNVWMQEVEYRAPEREPYMLNSMSVLTRNLSVHIYQTGVGPNLVFDGGLMATGTKLAPMHGPHDFKLKYEGWLFEDHGYYIWWWPK